MLSFACTTITCLIMNFGHGQVTTDDGRNFVYTTYAFKEAYACTRSAAYTHCRRMDGANCPITQPWKDQFGLHQSELDCR